MDSEITLPDKIHTIRGKQVMLDRDLAKLYGVETRALNQAVKRNKERFPEDFYFKIDETNLKSQTVISSWGGNRKLTFAFTQEGVAMLSGVLRSKKSIEVNIKIMRAFIKMRHFLQGNASVFRRLDRVELKQLEYDQHFNKIFKAIESKQLTPNQGIFYDGQLFDAFVFITDLIKEAKKEIILIDNYINEDTLTLLSHKKQQVIIKIYTKEINEQLKLAVSKFNQQYKNLEIIKHDKSHDRFLIIDNQTYHIGASIKDVGKKWFAFSKININVTKKIQF